MILQALKEYYDRKAGDPESDIAPEGFEKKEIPFLVVIKPDGTLVTLEDTREKAGTRLVGKPYLLPRSQQRSGSKSYEKTFLLWDHIGYLFQHPESDAKARKQHRTWLASLDALTDELKADEGVAAILKFHRSGGVNAVKSAPNWEECTKLISCNMTFRLAGDTMPVPCRSVVQEYVRKTIASAAGEEKLDDASRQYAHCLVTGEYGEIARTHGRTPINKDTKSLVNFQKNSGYDSYGKEQGYNAPVCKSAEFAYTTALNALLKSERSRFQIGDASTVFWAAKDDEFEQQILDFFDEPPKDNPDRLVEAVKSLYRSVDTGAFVTDNDNTRFYVLGLSPNAARISVRFWHCGTVAEMAGRFRQHFNDTAICHGPKDKDHLSLWRLLVSNAVQGKSENIPPNLAGDTMRAILEGLAYPQTLLQAAIRRIRAEHEITYPRAALIKACINRTTRHDPNNGEKELNMSLDETNTNIGYRLGRLFANLEKLQIRVHTQKGGKEPNSTIRDRYYGAASGTPITVFGTLIRLSKHHLAKLENVGERVNFEKRFCEIMDGIQDFPAHLPLEDQGRFAIGYYHQMQDFFTKKTDKNE